MENTRDLVRKDFEKWRNTPPNLIQRGMGTVFTPVEFLLRPFVNAAAPLLEGVVKGANNFIADTIQKFSGELVDVNEFSELEFKEWIKRADIAAMNWVTGGIAALTAEGVATGLGGFKLLAVDIPASFGLIISYANKIALTYQLDITDEEVQVELIKAISAGSETSAKGKLSSTASLRTVSNIIAKQSWKSMEKAPAKSLPKLIFTIRALVKKLGYNITKRKAAQLVPIIGGVTGGAINGSWAADALEAVRQFSRMSVTETYYSKEKNKSCEPEAEFQV